MLKIFYPDRLYDSAYDVDYEDLYKDGYRGIIFDVDNTLVEHGAPVNKKASDLFDALKKTGYRVCIISNNSEERVKPLADALGADYVSKAGKPSAKNYIKAADMMGLDITHVFFVGDQIFTDILGANRADMMSVLVRPISPHEEIQIVLKRYLEKVVLYFYHRKSRKEDNYESY